MKRCPTFHCCRILDFNVFSYELANFKMAHFTISPFHHFTISPFHHFTILVVRWSDGPVVRWSRTFSYCCWVGPFWNLPPHNWKHWSQESYNNERLDSSSSSYFKWTFWYLLIRMKKFWKQNIQPLDHRTTGPPDHWTTGQPDHRTIGPPDHRTTGPPDHQNGEMVQWWNGEMVKWWNGDMVIWWNGEMV